MFSMIGHAIFGLIVGLVAKWLLPGPAPSSWLVTAIIGMAGGWMGGFLGRVVGLYKEGHPAGFIMSVIGAMILFYLYRFI